MTLGHYLNVAAASQPHKTALIDADGSITYEEFDRTTTVLAHWFLSQGLRPGDRVAIHWPNSIPTAQLYFAAFKAGIVAVPINLRLKSPEVSYVLSHAQPALCFSEPAFAPIAKEAAANCAGLRHVYTEMPDLTAGPTDELPDVSPVRPAVIIYTSGTTARPKGVTHSHQSLIDGVGLILGDLLDSDDIALTFTPMMHATGLMAVLIPIVMTGGSAVLLPVFHPASVLDAIERYRCTYAITLPALMQFVVEEQMRRPRDVSSLRKVGAGGDSVPVALQDRFQALFGIPLREGYGMTECFPVAFNRPGGMRQGSLGTVTPGVEVRIVDLSGRDVEVGETGEIVVLSPGTCLGYWNDPKATDELFEGGWVHTGDLACRDADGYLWFKGRKKQIIVRAGSNISPQEVEEVLYRHPAVLEVGVVGQPDEVYGELVVACVAPRTPGAVTEDELCGYARQYLADYKSPERIVFLDQLPKGISGKVDRRALKEMVAPVLA